MNKPSSRSSSKDPTDLDLTAAVEVFVANGGVISKVANNETAPSSASMTAHSKAVVDADAERMAKVEVLKGLVAKGAGFPSLQYSLRMNKKDIRKLASDHGVSINCSRSVAHVMKKKRCDADAIDDVVAGHAMHYSSLGYTASEIAHALGLSVRQVWGLSKAYRFDLRLERYVDTP